MEEAKTDVVSVFEGCPSETEEAGKASVCEGCPGRNLCLSQARPDEGMN